MREVVTLQVGNYANYVGAHYWNFQDELLGLAGDEEQGSHVGQIDSAVSFRVAETRQGVSTYAPRLLLFDLRGSLGAVGAAGSLYGAPPTPDLASVITWSGPKTVHAAERVPKNEFLRSLEEGEGEGEGEEEEEEEKEQHQHERAPSHSTAEEGTGQPSTSGRTAMLAAAHGRQLAASEADARADADRQRVAGLDEGVCFWTDYLKASLHPRSVLQLAGPQHGTSAFESYGEGAELLEGEECAEEARDRLRFFAEECDHLQGFQCWVDDSGGFSVVGAQILRELCDEYPRAPRLLFCVRPPLRGGDSSCGPPGTAPAPSPFSLSSSSVVRRLSDAVSLSTLSSLSDACFPLGLGSMPSGLFPHLQVDERKHYHTSALYAAALDNLTLPYRLRGGGANNGAAAGRPVGQVDMASLARLLSPASGANLAAAAISMPAPPVPGGGSAGARPRLTRGLTYLTPLVAQEGGHAHARSTPFSETYVLRGALEAQGSNKQASIQQAQQALEASILKEQRGGACVRHLALSMQPLAIPLPFPSIFGPTVGRSGEIIGGLPSGPESLGRRRGGADVTSIPLLTKGVAGPMVCPLVEDRLLSLRQLAIKRGAPGSALLAKWGIEKEEVNDMHEHMNRLAVSYGRDEDSDEDMEDD